MIQGRIIKIISNDYTVKAADQSYVCKSRGKFRNMGLTPLVGDLVLFDPVDHYILELLPRKNELLRPPVANIDQVFVVASVKEPDFSPHLLDKLLTIIEYHKMKPLICFTKLDLLTEEELSQFESIKAYYKKFYPVFENTELEALKACFLGMFSTFTGQSGAGKSTLLNQLDPSFQIQTGEISKALGRGRHTTRHVELLPLCGGLVADTPGFSSLQFYDMDEVSIRDQFPEFNEAKEYCEYRDCMHVKEEHCEIKKRVEAGTILKSRYESYLNFLESKKGRSEWN